ncbi:MAG: hypothetical protein HGA54_04845 [Actinobacteria bacterium]|nr:hypothetical protein [Actinomycetota bacterium]
MDTRPADLIIDVSCSDDPIVSREDVLGAATRRIDPVLRAVVVLVRGAVDPTLVAQ